MLWTRSRHRGIALADADIVHATPSASSSTSQGHFRISIPDYQRAQMRTCGDVIDVVDSLVTAS